MLVHNIREAGLTPMSVADVMKGRIKAIESNDPAQMNLWLYNYILTTDGIGSYRGKLKVLHGFFNSSITTANDNDFLITIKKSIASCTG